MYKMVNFSLNELRLIAESRGIRNYRNMSTERLLSAPERDSISARIKKIREHLNKLKCKFLRSKVNKIRRGVYETGNEENLSRSKIKEIKQNLRELETSLQR